MGDDKEAKPPKSNPFIREIMKGGDEKKREKSTSEKQTDK